jgi:hypothetical protein
MTQRFALATLLYSINVSSSVSATSSECDWFLYIDWTADSRIVSLGGPGGKGGTIPREVGLLTELTSLYFYENQLTSTLPTELGLLTGLTSLYLYFNQLTSAIPPNWVY